MFDEYPKKRPPLPKEIEDIYSSYYKENREGETAATSLSSRFEAWLHRQVARDVIHSGNAERATLELGAGTLNQLQYEAGVHPYDIVEPFTDLYKDSPLLARIRNVYSNISDVPSENRYERITSIAVLEHICDLPYLVAKSGILLTGDGVFRASIPNEGNLLWKLSWKLTTGLEFRLKHGLDYELLMKHEHVNSADEIEKVLVYFFEDVSCRKLGLSKSVSFYRFYECRNPRTDRCFEYFEKRR